VATNVIRHVAPPFPDATLSIRITLAASAVTVEIWYLGEPFQPPAQLQPDLSGESEGGFGLYIISQSVGSVTYENPLPGVCCTRLVQPRPDSAN
jgi:phosphoserine phosphatase RsbU/P